MVIEEGKKHLYLSKRTQSKKSSEGYIYKTATSVRSAKKFLNVNAAQEWRDDCGNDTALVVKSRFEGRRIVNRDI